MGPMHDTESQQEWQDHDLFAQLWLQRTLTFLSMDEKHYEAFYSEQYGNAAPAQARQDFALLADLAQAILTQQEQGLPAPARHLELDEATRRRLKILAAFGAEVTRKPCVVILKDCPSDPEPDAPDAARPEPVILQQEEQHASPHHSGLYHALERLLKEFAANGGSTLMEMSANGIGDPEPHVAAAVSLLCLWLSRIRRGDYMPVLYQCPWCARYGTKPEKQGDWVHCSDCQKKKLRESDRQLRREGGDWFVRCRGMILYLDVPAEAGLAPGDMVTVTTRADVLPHCNPQMKLRVVRRELTPRKRAQ